jgi:peptidoglycan/LPS O-acetylase OafA/YrhL
LIRERKYFEVIDSLRGQAAVMVCLYHFVCTTSNYIQDEFVLNIFSLGQYGVHIFFVISGIVIPLSMIKHEYSVSKLFPYLFKRMARIEPPYIISLFVFMLYILLKQKYFKSSIISVSEMPSLIDFLAHLGYLVPFFDNIKWFINTYWSLAIEFQYYLLLSVIFPFMMHGKIIVRVISNAFFLSLGLIYFNTSFLPTWTPIFMLGITYALFINSRISLLEFLIFEVLSMVLIYYYFNWIELGTCLLTIFSIHFLSSYSTKLSRFFGQISYSLYLLHGVTGSLIINYLSHTLTSPLQKCGVITFGFMCTILCSFIFYWLIEKPSQQFSKNIKL